jgi:hypothetical protein
MAAFLDSHVSYFLTIVQSHSGYVLFSLCLDGFASPFTRLSKATLFHYLLLANSTSITQRNICRSYEHAKTPLPFCFSTRRKFLGKHVGSPTSLPSFPEATEELKNAIKWLCSCCVGFLCFHFVCFSRETSIIRFRLR